MSDKSKTMKQLTFTKSIFVALLSLVSWSGFAQQEFQFTQFMHNQLFYNPAYAGVPSQASLSAFYRNQWVGFDGAPESRLLSFNTPLLGERVGLGLIVSNHSAGLFNNWYGSMAYSYQLRVSEDLAVRFGLQGSMRYYGMDFEDPSVYIREEGDPSFSENMEDQFTGNFGMGLHVTYKKIFLAVSVPHFFPNEISLNSDDIVTLVAKEAPHYYLMAGVELPLKEGFTLKPAVFCKYVENAPFDLDANLSVVIKEQITAGVSYRLGGDGAGESVDLMALYQYKNFGFGLAYDILLFDIGQHSSGSFEALVRYEFLKAKDDMVNPRFITE